MKSNLILIILIIFSSCSKEYKYELIKGDQGISGLNGSSCSVSRLPSSDFVTVTCGEYAVNVYDGNDGEAGIQGELGSIGPQGIQGPSGPVGAVGPVGPRGAAGPAGTNALGCTLANQGHDHWLLTCGSNSILVNNID